VAVRSAGIENPLIAPANEFKLVTFRVQGQLEDAGQSLFLTFAVVIAREVSFLRFPAGADDKFADAPPGIKLAFRVLWGANLS